MTTPRLLPLLLAASVSTGCLSSLVPGEPETIRYFSPDVVAGTSAHAPGPGFPLRLRRVGAASHLAERWVWRSSPVEIGYYERLRWSEPPVEALTRALARELFETRGNLRTEALDAPALDVELVAFEELVEPEHAARVVAVARLHDPSGPALFERTYERVVPVEGGEPEDVARASARALSELVRAVASTVGETVGGE